MIKPREISADSWHSVPTSGHGLKTRSWLRDNAELAGSATFPDGSPTGLVSVPPVHADKIPMPPGSGLQARFIVTVQADGEPPRDSVYSSITSPLYETLLDVGTRNADGQTTDEGAVAAIWADFAGPIPGVRRKLLDGHNQEDGTEMRYWVEAGSELYPEVFAFCQLLEAMLNPEPMDPRLNGIGTCVAWSRFFHETLRAQGISGSVLVTVTANFPNALFLVKTWTFEPNGAAPAHCAPFSHLEAQTMDLSGASGQGTENPPGDFFNHFIVLFDGKYYDPSYGSGPFGGATDLEARIAWENASISGFMTICTGGIQVAKPNDPNTAEMVFAFP